MKDRSGPIGPWFLGVWSVCQRLIWGKKHCWGNLESKLGGVNFRHAIWIPNLLGFLCSRLFWVLCPLICTAGFLSTVGASRWWVGVWMDVGKEQQLIVPIFACFFLLGALIVLVPYELLDHLWGFQSLPILTSIVKVLRDVWISKIWTLQLVQICMGACVADRVFGGRFDVWWGDAPWVFNHLWWLVAVHSWESKLSCCVFFGHEHLCTLLGRIDCSDDLTTVVLFPCFDGHFFRPWHHFGPFPLLGLPGVKTTWEPSGRKYWRWQVGSFTKRWLKGWVEIATSDVRLIILRSSYQGQRQVTLYTLGKTSPSNVTFWIFWGSTFFLKENNWVEKLEPFCESRVLRGFWCDRKWEELIGVEHFYQSHRNQSVLWKILSSANGVEPCFGVKKSFYKVYNN